MGLELVNSRASLDLHIDLPLGRGKGPAVITALRSAIADGRLSPGGTLPPYRVLAHDLGISRSTAAHAYSALAEEGWLETTRGSGTRVARRITTQPASTSAPTRPASMDTRLDLRQGIPSPDLFPRQAWARASRTVMAGANPGLFLPAGPQGHEPLRTALADYLARTRGVLCGPDDIIIVPGYSEALQLLIRAFQGHQHLAEDIGLPFHWDILRADSTATTLLTVDADGAQPPQRTPPAGSFFHLTPAHQFPLGHLMTPERRRAFVGMARDTDSWIVEDDYDGEFRYDRKPVGALQPLAPERVIYVGSTSKALSPAVRLAWVVAPPDVRDALLEAKGVREQHVSALLQAPMAQLIAAGGYDQAVRRARARYRRRRHELIDALGALPNWHVSGADAGLHLTLATTSPAAHHETAALLKKHRIRFDALATFSRTPGATKHGILLGFSRPSEARWAHARDVAVQAMTQAQSL